MKQTIWRLWVVVGVLMFLLWLLSMKVHRLEDRLDANSTGLLNAIKSVDEDERVDQLESIVYGGNGETLPGLPEDFYSSLDKQAERAVK